MQEKSISELEKEYELELGKIVSEIGKNKVKKVLLQFPDGLKPYATTIADEIEKRAKCECLIWFGTCYGACDTPKVDVDLVVQFGHSKWIKPIQ
jgi:2-(3-amino-3-carboxypropyl)histidine synthase